MYKRLAKAYSYDGTRKLTDIKGIVIHWTSGSFDTAKNNVDFFATSNTRYAGAHYFTDKKGYAGRSLPLKYIANAVGGGVMGDGGKKYYNILNNTNTVSIELCSSTYEEPYNRKQIKRTKKLIKYIRSKCPNIRYIARHYDINGKCCPATLITPARWKQFVNDVGCTDLKYTL